MCFSSPPLPWRCCTEACPPAAGRAAEFAVGLYVFVLAGLVGSLVGGGTGLANFARLLVTATAAVVGMQLWQPDLGQVRRLSYAWLAGSTINVTAALLLTAEFVGQRPRGYTTHPNALGLTCAMSIAFALFLHSAGGSRDRRAAVLFATAALVGVAISGSRSRSLPPPPCC